MQASNNLLEYQATGPRLRPRRLDPAKWNRWPLELQIGSSLALAMAVIALAYLVFPNPAEWGKRYLLVSSHEGFHGIVGFLTGGTLHNIDLRADGSGLAIVSGHHLAATAAAGALFPVLLGAILVVLGVTRMWMPFMLMFVSLPLFWLGYEHRHIIEVQTALWAWGGIAILTAWFCPYHTVRRGMVILIGAALLIGSYDALPYLWVEWVDGPMLAQGPPIGPGASIGQIPSDLRIIADEFNQSGIDDVRALMLSTMVVILFLAACSIARFIFIYRR